MTRPSVAAPIADVELYIEDKLKSKFFPTQSLPVTNSLRIELDGDAAGVVNAKTFTVAFFPKRAGQVKPLKVKFLSFDVRHVIGETAQVKGIRWTGGGEFVLRFGSARSVTQSQQPGASTKSALTLRASSGHLLEDARGNDQMHILPSPVSIAPSPSPLSPSSTPAGMNPAAVAAAVKANTAALARPSTKSVGRQQQQQQQQQRKAALTSASAGADAPAAREADRQQQRERARHERSSRAAAGGEGPSQQEGSRPARTRGGAGATRGGAAGAGSPRAGASPRVGARAGAADEKAKLAADGHHDSPARTPGAKSLRVYMKNDDLKAELATKISKGAKVRVLVKVAVGGQTHVLGRLMMSWMNRGNTLGLDIPARWALFVGSSGNIATWERSAGPLDVDVLEITLTLKEGVAGQLPPEAVADGAAPASSGEGAGKEDEDEEEEEEEEGEGAEGAGHQAGDGEEEHEGEEEGEEAQPVVWLGSRKLHFPGQLPPATGGAVDVVVYMDGHKHDTIFQPDLVADAQRGRLILRFPPRTGAHSGFQKLLDAAKAARWGVGAGTPKGQPPVLLLFVNTKSASPPTTPPSVAVLPSLSLPDSSATDNLAASASALPLAPEPASQLGLPTGSPPLAAAPAASPSAPGTSPQPPSEPTTNADAATRAPKSDRLPTSDALSEPTAASLAGRPARARTTAAEAASPLPPAPASPQADKAEPLAAGSKRRRAPSDEHASAGAGEEEHRPPVKLQRWDTTGMRGVSDMRGISAGSNKQLYIGTSKLEGGWHGRQCPEWVNLQVLVNGSVHPDIYRSQIVTRDYSNGKVERYLMTEDRSVLGAVWWLLGHQQQNIERWVLYDSATPPGGVPALRLSIKRPDGGFRLPPIFQKGAATAVPPPGSPPPAVTADTVEAASKQAAESSAAVAAAKQAPAASKRAGGASAAAKPASSGGDAAAEAAAAAGTQSPSGKKAGRPLGSGKRAAADAAAVEEDKGGSSKKPRAPAVKAEPGTPPSTSGKARVKGPAQAAEEGVAVPKGYTNLYIAVTKLKTDPEGEDARGSLPRECSLLIFRDGQQIGQKWEVTLSHRRRNQEVYLLLKDLNLREFVYSNVGDKRNVDHWVFRRQPSPGMLEMHLNSESAGHSGSMPEYESDVEDSDA